MDKIVNMPTKEETLQIISDLAKQQAVTKEEIMTAYNQGTGIIPDQILTKKVSVTEILYYIGGGVVFLGISILMAQNWSVLGFETKVLATLGVSIMAYLVGILFGQNTKTETVGSAFYLISALVAPIGLYVIFENAGFDITGPGIQSLISGILFCTYLFSFIVFRKNIFTLFSIIFGTWLFYSLTGLLAGSSPYFGSSKFYQYQTLIAGLSYALLGYSFSKTERAPLRGFLYGFGILGFLGASMALGGWEPNQSIFWELLFPVLVFGTLFLSVYIKSKSFLVFGTLFLMGYILKITAEYFSNSLGWPLVLVISGLSMIGIGYMSFAVKKKYLSSD